MVRLGRISTILLIATLFTASSLAGASHQPQRLLGEGDENWSEVIPILNHKTGTRWFIIEQETYPFPPLDCAQKCLQNFQALMAKF